MRRFGTAVAFLMLAAGCAAPDAYRGPWAVEIQRPGNQAAVPQKDLTEAEKGFFLSPEFQKEINHLESGTRWFIDSDMWILWGWDWTNHVVIIRRGKAE